ncbi:protein-disulfide reductase DsbD domain-containing protein [Devosia sp. 2618]|uniref:protein-disulfide reductase DsbD domain-containing protein n=1 Tax=Devosia sp. 2618 TaxID=3156454 RepID=UPI0033985A68
MHLSSIAFTIALIALPVHAGETAWQEVAPGVKLRLISTGQIKPDGTTLVGVEIDMPENTKTYWRVPGDTGLPTELSFSPEHGVVGHKVIWPYPKRQQTPDYLDYVYFGPTVLPVEITVDGTSPVAEVEALLGVCSDVCVPAQAKFSLSLSDLSPDRANGLRIRQAAAMAPIEWTGDVDPFGTVELRLADKMLAVELTNPNVDPASLIAATTSGDPVFGAPQKSPEPNLVLIPIMGKGDHAGLKGESVQLTFKTDLGAFEVERQIAQ